MLIESGMFLLDGARKPALLWLSKSGHGFVGF